MQHAILFGEYELTIDDKNRLLIPSEIRKLLDPQRDGLAFFVTVGQNLKPWLYAERYYEHLALQVEQEITPDNAQLAFDQMHFARARRVEWDRQGRILIPDKTLKRTGTGREVTLIGVRNHLEIWNRQEWDQREQELTSRMNEVAQQARQTRRTLQG